MILSDDVKATFNAMHEGILIIDREETIVFGNTAYLKFVHEDSDVDMSMIEGKKLRELRPGAQLPEVMTTGKAIMHAPRRELKDIYFVNMYPIYNHDRIIGGLSVVTFMDDAEKFKGELEAMQRRNQQVLDSISKGVSLRTFDKIVAKGRKSISCKAYAEKIAATEFPILIISESGTGKGAYAQAIHNASDRRDHIYIRTSCTASPETLAADLFGMEAGVSPAQPLGSIGLLETADQGTLFIDEISEMPLNVQSMFYNALQRKSFKRVGGRDQIQLNARIITSSSADLHEYIAAGRFRPELYYFLNTFSLIIPPLRERMDDVPVIVRQELKGISRKIKTELDITDEAMDRLMSHSWPGNVRELINVLQFSSYLAKDGMITADSLPENIGQESRKSDLSLVERVRAFEKSEILKALEFYGDDVLGKKKAAEELGISLASLYNKIK